MKIGEIFWKTFGHCGGGDGGPVVLLALLFFFLLLSVGPKVGNLKWTGRWVFSLIIIEEDLDPKSLGGILLFTSKEATEPLLSVCLFVCFFPFLELCGLQ
jgi:hypothetical protein